MPRHFREHISGSTSRGRSSGLRQGETAREHVNRSSRRLPRSRMGRILTPRALHWRRSRRGQGGRNLENRPRDRVECDPDPPAEKIEKDVSASSDTRSCRDPAAMTASSALQPRSRRGGRQVREGRGQPVAAQRLRKARRRAPPKRRGRSGRRRGPRGRGRKDRNEIHFPQDRPSDRLDREPYEVGYGPSFFFRLIEI